MIYLPVDVPGLAELRHEIVVALESHESGPLKISRTHGFSPHMTLAYVEPGSPTPDPHQPVDVAFDRVAIVCGAQRHDFHLAAHATAMGIGDGSLHVPGPMEADDKHKAQSAAQAPSMETNMTRAEQAAIEKRYGKPLDEIEPEIMRSLGYRWTGTNGWQKQPRRHSRDLARRIRRDARRASRYRGQPGGGPREDVNIRHATHEMLAAIKAEDIRRHFGGMSRIYASYIGGYDRR